MRLQVSKGPRSQPPLLLRHNDTIFLAVCFLFKEPPDEWRLFLFAQFFEDYIKYTAVKKNLNKVTASYPALQGSREYTRPAVEFIFLESIYKLEFSRSKK